MAAAVYNPIMLYIDVYFLINLTMDMILITLTGHIRKNKPAIRRYLAASLVGAAWSLVPILSPQIPAWVLGTVSYAGICALMCRIAFSARGVRQTAAAVAVLYLVTWGMGGVLNFLYFRTEAGVWLRNALYGQYQVPGIWWLLICAAMAGGVWILAWNWYQHVRSFRKIIYPVEIQMGERKVEAMALLDTGNRLYTPGGKPVSVMDPDLARVWLGDEEIRQLEQHLEGGIPYILIPYQSIGQEQGLMAVIKADWMIIHKDTSDETVAFPAIGISQQSFSEGKEYRVILHAGI